MLRIVLAYRSEDRESDPEVLYAGHDAEAAIRVIDGSDRGYVKLELAEVATARRVRPNADSMQAPGRAGLRAPTLDEALAMIAEIDRLRATLEAQSKERAEEIAGIQEEFKRQITVAVGEIKNWKELAERLEALIAAKGISPENTLQSPAANAAVGMPAGGPAAASGEGASSKPEQGEAGASSKTQSPHEPPSSSPAETSAGSGKRHGAPKVKF